MIPLPHCSHAFIPYDPHDHRGVYFPTGLERLPMDTKESAGSTPPGEQGERLRRSERFISTGFGTAAGAEDLL